MSVMADAGKFLFRVIRARKYRYTDARDGASSHFLARMRKGHCRIETERQTLEVAEGEIFYIPYGLPYRSYWYGSEAIEFDSLAFLDFPEAKNGDYALQVLEGNAQIHALMDQITAAPQVCSATLGLFYTLLAILLPRMQTRNGDGSDRRIVLEAKRCLSESPRIRMSELAKRCGVSESGLYHIFRREAHMTPNELRQSILIEKAVRLLTTTQMGVEQISQELEFSSASYFRKVFLAQTGKTPRQVRKENRGI